MDVCEYEVNLLLQSRVLHHRLLQCESGCHPGACLPCPRSQYKKCFCGGTVVQVGGSLTLTACRTPVLCGVCTVDAVANLMFDIQVSMNHTPVHC